MDIATEGPDRLLISIRDAAKRLGIGRDATYGLVREGRLPSVRVGRRLLVPASSLVGWVERELESTRTEA